ncbi:Hsp20/alpha crystallin family protein [Metabacillus arenae]|uniref:Hsp20/alpha crystallin family protein n=1 Tax=Metabacillus arenae TaxID=2771434 RepID=A0A926NHE6_9BACI|nr:Hsp20/alpha crystallin family protein [Metabacillus arenae]MBD1381654.1 Hsp20/alpha crystallin family protein [Metabacillus arenae]
MDNQKDKKNALQGLFSTSDPFIKSIVEPFLQSEPVKQIMGDLNNFLQNSIQMNSMDIKTNEEKGYFIIEVTLPAGINRENIELDVKDQVLTITFLHEEEREIIHEPTATFNKSLKVSHLTRSLLLPFPAERKDLTVLYQQKVLLIKLPNNRKSG